MRLLPRIVHVSYRCILERGKATADSSDLFEIWKKDKTQIFTSSPALHTVPLPYCGIFTSHIRVKNNIAFMRHLSFHFRKCLIYMKKTLSNGQMSVANWLKEPSLTLYKIFINSPIAGQLQLTISFFTEQLTWSYFLLTTTTPTSTTTTNNNNYHYYDEVHTN